MVVILPLASVLRVEEESLHLKNKLPWRWKQNICTKWATSARQQVTFTLKMEVTRTSEIEVLHDDTSQMTVVFN